MREDAPRIPSRLPLSEQPDDPSVSRLIGWTLLILGLLVVLFAFILSFWAAHG